jgi:hypothetical protein
VLVAVDVTVGVAVLVGVLVAVNVAVDVAVLVGVLVAVSVAAVVGVLVAVEVAVFVAVSIAVDVLPGVSVPLEASVAVLVAVKLGGDNFVGVNNTNVPVDEGVIVGASVERMSVGAEVFSGVTVAFGTRVGTDAPGVRKKLIQMGGVRIAGSSGGRL